MHNRLDRLKQEVLADIRDQLEHVDEVSALNTRKVLDAMRDCRVSLAHFTPTTGYAYGDLGRETLDRLYARVFRAERALVRTQFASGTHALATVLFGWLRPNDELISLTGTPYDTMQTVIGHARPSKGSLKEFGIGYRELPLVKGKVDLEGIDRILSSKTKMVLIQRSRGYAMRDPLTLEDIERICSTVKKINADIVTFVDNCYGEFVEPREPIEAGADVVAGSLIKNIGGGLAPTGGYIAGRGDVVEQASYRLTAPGAGDEVGATLCDGRLLLRA